MPEPVAEHHIAVRRTARYYTMGDVHAPSDVWLVCHGFAQLAAGFIEEFQPIARQGRLIIAPEALNRFYLAREGGRAGPSARVGATWMTREDRLAEIDDYVRYLDGLLNERIDDAGRSDVRVTALGYSQGVATVMRWLVQGTSTLDRVILWAGTLPPEIDPAGAAHARLAAADLHIVLGTSDEMINRADVETQRAALASARVPLRYIEFHGGHRMDATTLRELADA
jgi:predicted esterase